MRISKEVSRVIKEHGYNPEDYTEGQILQLEVGLENNLDITQYINPVYNNNQMYQIALGLKKGLEMYFQLVQDNQLGVTQDLTREELVNRLKDLEHKQSSHRGITQRSTPEIN